MGIQKLTGTGVPAYSNVGRSELWSFVRFPTVSNI